MCFFRYQLQLGIFNTAVQLPQCFLQLFLFPADTVCRGDCPDCVRYALLGLFRFLNLLLKLLYTCIAKLHIPFQLTAPAFLFHLQHIQFVFLFLCLIQFLIQQQKLLQGFRCLSVTQLFDLLFQLLHLFGLAQSILQLTDKVITDNGLQLYRLQCPCDCFQLAAGGGELLLADNQLLQLLFYGIGTDKGYLIQFRIHMRHCIAAV